MTVNYHGNAVDITFSIGDTTAPITLADGYSIEDILIVRNTGIFGISYGIPIPTSTNITLHFPPVNSCNPNTIIPLFDNTKEQPFTFLITKFGQIPNANYFDKAFNPILVVGNDGNEYNVIPSNQFK